MYKRQILHKKLDFTHTGWTHTPNAKHYRKDGSTHTHETPKLFHDMQLLVLFPRGGHGRSPLNLTFLDSKNCQKCSHNPIKISSRFWSVFLTLFGAKMTPQSDPKILKISIKRHSEPQSSPQHSTKSSQSPFGLQNEAKMLPI